MRNRVVTVPAYTFYSVRWATQKGDILGVRAQKVAQLGGEGGQIVVFGACVAQLVWPSSKYRGGTALYFFQIVEATKNPFHLCIAIVDNADLPSLCL